MRSVILNFGVAFVLVFALGTAAQAASDVSSTMHNLSATGSFEYFSDEPQVCIFCHTPHGGSLSGPLWNRNFTAQPFTMYKSDTTSATVNTVATNQTVNAESMLCLACHDGSVSVYEMINYSSIGQPKNINANDTQVGIVDLGPGGYNANLGGGDLGTFGGNLSDDHPISFSYSAVVNDYLTAGKTGLHVSPTNSAIRLFTSGVGVDRVECSTCHNPHEATLPRFLVMSNSGSALCLACHDK